MYKPFDQPGKQEFEQILQDGITAAKSGQRLLAQSLLRQAIMLDGSDARPYIWLIETTDDLYEKRQFLEHAVAVDPNNSAARRGLALLTGKINPAELAQEAPKEEPLRPAEPEEAQAQPFLCPQCGGRMSYSVSKEGLVCESCGYLQLPEAELANPQDEQVLDFVIPTRRGQRWAEAQHRLKCEQCGALSILPPGQVTVQCPYCGSNQLIESVDLGELVDPHGITLMKIDARQVKLCVKSWLGKGLFAPDDLLAAVKKVRLRPAYYSCWAFDGALEVKWSCEVKEGSGRDDHWAPRNGSETTFFDDVLITGVKGLTPRELSSIEPFNLKELLEFKPEYLAGWPALVYDRSLADASLLARERVMKKLRGELNSRIEPGKEKRNIRTGAGNWSGVTFRHLLLPLWIGAYHYRGKEYHLLVNGQTGKVSGNKPVDVLKVVMAVLIAGVSIFLFGWIVYWLWINYGYLIPRP